MKKPIVIIVVLAFALPSSLAARQWTAEQQEFLTFFQALGDSLIQGPTTYEYWEKQVRPDADLMWWFTHKPMPLDVDSVKKLSAADDYMDLERYVYIDIKPIDIKVRGNLYFIYCYNSAAWLGKKGDLHRSESKRLEIYERTKGKFHFLGGMVTPTTEANW